MRIAFICPSGIAYRRFMPAIEGKKELEFAGVGVSLASERLGAASVTQVMIDDTIGCDGEKVEALTAQYGGKIYDRYEAIVT